MTIFTWQKQKAAPPRTLYGVNLGGWLVLEKWITPSVFKGLAADEYSLCKDGDPEVIEAIKKHRDTFITQADFEWLSQQGIEAVRLPVGHGIFGDAAPYLKSVQYVDKAFGWAQKAGIKVILDLHTAPGSQNGGQESGSIGRVGWHRDRTNIAWTLKTLHEIAGRYGNRKNLLGIELLNEPSAKIPMRILVRFYRAAYRLIRQDCGDDVWIIYSDAYKPRRYRRILRGNKYVNVYMDTHQYQAFSRRDKSRQISSHLRKTLKKVPRKLQGMARRHGVIVGEWSIALDPLSLKELNDGEKSAAWRAYGAAQQLVFERTAGWFYWTYRTEEGGAWSFRDCIETGMLVIPKRDEIV